MVASTSIEWTDKTWGPVRGCAIVSEGCRNCYAMRIAHRFSGAGKPYDGLTVIGNHGPRWTGRARFVPEALGAPLRWRKPQRIFVNSMSDLFHEDITFEQIAAVYGVMAACPQHTFQVLTKRPERRRVFNAWLAGMLGGRLTHCCMAALDMERENHDLGDGGPLHTKRCADPDGPWPLANVWEGVSVEDRKYGVPRIDILRNTPAAVRFLSIEPLLEDLDTLDLRGIDWVIVGAESGNGARPMNMDWVRGIRDQAVDQGCAFFLKQDADKRGRAISLPVLDGRQWAEFPKEG